MGSGENVQMLQNDSGLARCYAQGSLAQLATHSYDVCTGACMEVLSFHVRVAATASQIRGVILEFHP